MAVYAAQMTKADSGIAQITQTLQDLGYLNNTLLLIFSDNGASAEDVSTRGLHKVDARVGDRDSYLSYGRNWATVSNTFRGYKARPSKVVFAPAYPALARGTLKSNRDRYRIRCRCERHLPNHSQSRRWTPR